MKTFSLSPAQQQVIAHRGGPLQVIACAGSGKTESVSRRIAGLIAEGAEPGSIVAFTFTERAAAELKDRIVRRVGEEMGATFLDRLGPMFVGTIHAYCFRILQDHVPHYGNYDVLDEHRHAGLLSREYHALGLSRIGIRHWKPIQDWIRTVDVIGNELIDPNRLDGTPVGEVYRAYRAMLDRYHFLTFGLIITCALEALRDPAVFRRVHEPLRHLIVDEYQDINPAQERLIELLATAPVNLCVVGDDDQSIYQWRGSDVRNILDFTHRYPGASTVNLAHNRRSRPLIVTEANRFAATIPARLPKTMESVRPEGPHEIVSWMAVTDADEARMIADTIERLHLEGFQYRDIAVLFRSVRTSALLLINELRTRRIPYTCAGRTGLFLQPEIALLGETFAWFVDGEWKDERFGAPRPADVEHIVAGLDEAFGNGTAIPGLKQYIEDWRKYRLRGRESVSLVGDFYKLLHFLGAHHIDPETSEGSARLGAFARFSKVLADYEHVNRRASFVDNQGQRSFRSGRDRGKPYFQNLYNYLLHYARDAYEDFEGEETAELDAVDILTIHQAKGLEWPVVFIPALVQGRFPSRMTGTAQQWLLPEDVFPPAVRARYEGSEAEERRLFYVALTRARYCAYLSAFERKTNRFKPSPFLLEVAGRTPAVRDQLPLPLAPDSMERELPPLEIAFSDVALFEECGYRYRLGAVLGFEQELAVELGYGKAIHHVLRQVAEVSRAQSAVPAPDELRTLIDDAFYLPFADRQAYDRMHQAADRLVSNYVDRYASDLRRIWAVERPFELHLADGRVSGRADIILDEETGRTGSLAIVDYKVAAGLAREDRYQLQLQVYTAAGRGEGLNVEGAYLHELRDGTRHSVPTAPDAVSSAVKRIGESVGRIRAAGFDPTREAAKCKECDYHPVCRHCLLRG